MSIRVIRWQSLTETPWKNGGGTAVDIATEPPLAALADFDWRVNVATIARAGPFSDFPGVDRHIRLLDGGPVTLRIGDRAAVTVEPDGDGIAFPGDVPTHAELAGPPCRAFNVLTRRGAFTAAVEHRTVEGTPTIHRHGADWLITFVLDRDGPAAVAGIQQPLQPFDTVLAGEDVRLVTVGPAHLLVVRMTKTA